MNGNLLYSANFSVLYNLLCVYWSYG